MMKRFIIALIVVLLVPLFVHSQTIIQTFTDPCTKVVSTFTIPITGSTVIVFYNKSRTFTSADVSSGVFMQWINQVYEDYRKISPCSQTQATQTTNQVTTSAVSSAVSQAASSVTSSVTSSATSAPSGGGESTTSSESSSDSKSESKGGGGKSGGKGGGRSQAKMNPILFNSDLTAGQSLDRNINLIITGGISQSSMAGDASWGVTGMVWSNLKQFALSGRYTKMYYDEGKMKSISNFGATIVHAFGNTFGFITYAYIRPMDKLGVVGVNSTLSVMNTADGVNISNSLLMFYTKSFQLNRKISLSPDLYLAGSPLTYTIQKGRFIENSDINILTGCSVDYSLTRRFKANVGLRTSLSTNSDIPPLLFAVVGSKINL